jgi:hypothetical protein
MCKTNYCILFIYMDCDQLTELTKTISLSHINSFAKLSVQCRDVTYGVPRAYDSSYDYAFPHKMNHQLIAYSTSC